MSGPLPFGIYVHIPFCIQKCYYCDFATAPYRRERVGRFLEALIREVRQKARLLDSAPPMEAVSIFFGGGTPSLLSGGELGQVLEALREHYPIAPDAEITVEANPETLDAPKLRAYRALGVNRLSIGAQDFHDAELSQLGRTHRAEQIQEAVLLAREAGFENVNLDLMFALPGQSRSHWEESLSRAVALRPEHLSAYQLTLEPKTVFSHWYRQGRLSLPDEELSAELYEVTLSRLEAAGYRQYEISNFALPGYACRHNRLYWENRPYVGLGPSAWSYWNEERLGNVRGAMGYILRLERGEDPVAERERLEGRRAWAEAMTLGLRLREGVSEEEFRTRYGVSFGEAFGEVVPRLIAMGFLERVDNRVRLTRRGLFVADAVFVEFF